MSIIIKNMELPKNCDVCPFHVIETEELLYSCVITGQFPILPHDNKRSCECVLIELPPHGRLIDSDVLEKEAQKRMLICSKNDNQFQQPYEIMRAIALAPTVIPAEEGE